MTHNGLPSKDPQAVEPVGPYGQGPRVLETVSHVTAALSRYVRQLHLDGVVVPREVEELTAFLVHLARIRQVPPVVAARAGNEHDLVVPDRMLVTKHEAALLLGVSVRTVERLVATGRLQQVQVARLARFRVGDLEAYVRALPATTN